MSGSASISGNTASSGGGGVYASGDICTMSGSASISGNTAYDGSGLSVGGGSFTMRGSASISGNTASYGDGGGVSVDGGSFTMSGSASVFDNTAYGGSGVSVGGGSFTMSGGGVSGNTASGGRGGGVNVASGSFIKTGGIIYGSNETDVTLQNVVKDSSGVKQTNRSATVYGDSAHRRETTVTADQNLSAIYNNRQWTFEGQWSD
jgi:predicted outer membrane repeat protein